MSRVTARLSRWPSGEGVRGGAPLGGQTVLVIGGGSGIGLEAARRARDAGAKVIITARDPHRVHRAGLELGAAIAAFDATDFDRLDRFFGALPTPIDHLLVTGPGPDDARLADFDVDAARRDVDGQLLLPLEVARNAAGRVRPGGTLLFIARTAGRRTAPGRAFHAALTAALATMTKNLALELAPIRVNLIAAGFVDPPRPASPLGDIAALAVQLMTDTAVSGATFDSDGGRQLVET